MRCRRVLLGTTLLLQGADATWAGSGAVHFHVTYTEMRQGDGERLAILHEVDIALEGGSRIVATESAWRPGHRGRSKQSDSTLGGSFRQFYDRARSADWKVEGEDTLVRRSRRTTDTEVLVVKSLSVNTCKAGVGYVLLPGQSTYDRRSGSYSSVIGEDVTCTVSTGAW
jgi:hypothetical protein